MFNYFEENIRIINVIVLKYFFPVELPYIVRRLFMNYNSKFKKHVVYSHPRMVYFYISNANVNIHMNYEQF